MGVLSSSPPAAMAVAELVCLMLLRALLSISFFRSVSSACVKSFFFLTPLLPRSAYSYCLFFNLSSNSRRFRSDPTPETATLLVESFKAISIAHFCGRGLELLSRD
jgi:hypothetical protein